MKKMETEQEKWELPERHQLNTPERIAANEAAQRELAAKVNSPFANVSPAEHERARAFRLIPEHQGTLAALQTIAARLSKLRRPSRAALKQLEAARSAIPAIKTQLAEAYALTGAYDLAVAVEPDELKRAEYLAVWNAVWRADEEWCDCPVTTAGHSQQYVKQEVWSVRDNAFRPLLACVGCGCLNVAHLPKHIAEARAHRATARAITQGLKPDEAKRVLLAHGHTTQKLLR
jgi:hypothetical protein